MITNSDQRVGMFVDIQNLYHSAKNLFNARVNYTELVQNLVSDRKLIRLVAYVVKAEGIIDDAGVADERTGRAISPEAAFFKALEEAGFELQVKDLQVYAGGAKKADWDVGLAIDAVRASSALDVVILVTGDGDFVPLVDYLRIGLGKVVEVAAFSRSTSSRLREAADHFVTLEEIPKILLKIKKQRKRASSAG